MADQKKHHDWKAIEEFALKFSKDWEKASSEKSDGQNFVRAFLRVFGQTENVGQFEKPVELSPGHKKYIDFFWEGKIAIEMKSRGEKLDAAFEQIKEYMALLQDAEPPDLWMVCDFENIRIYYHRKDIFFDFKTSKLRKHIKHFAPLAGRPAEDIRGDKEAVNMQATAKMNNLFEALQAHGYKGKELEVYLARLLFCFFADDTRIFPQNSFYHYIEESSSNGADLSGRLAQMFQDLNRPEDARVINPFLTDKVKQAGFRYINGGLFEEKLDLASFDKKMRATLLDCLGFDWSQISPAIFGSMFQGVMDKEHRREIGAHYTSEDNILKLIDALFMDELKTEFEAAKKKASPKALSEFHNKIASLKFLDPACGCGNFLIIAYKELRQLEHQLLKEQWRLEGHDHQLLNIETHFKVSVEQFYGIEILSWPCQIAKTGMWLMDHLMNIEASEKFGKYFDRLPLTKGAEIINANAHRIDWESLAPKGEFSYIMGNPPFGGARTGKDEEEQKRKKEDMQAVFGGLKGAGDLDYVSAWYKKAAEIMKSNKKIRTAYVSTNSITQGEQVAILWKPLYDRCGIHIDFAHRTFKWGNEAKGKAAVHCVIVGFSTGNGRERAIYDGAERMAAKNINPYLVEAQIVFVESRGKPLCDVPQIGIGNKPIDGGNYLFAEAEKKEFLLKEPQAKKWFRPFVGSDEFINGYTRYCLWLGDCPPSELKNMPEAMKRVEAVRQFRLNSKSAPTQKIADSPRRFHVENMPETNYIIVPRVSSERRNYIPIGFLTPEVLTSDSAHIIPNANLYHFGVLTSSVHMAWVRAVCGRLEMRYRYSGQIVYNNFPWPDATDKQKGQIEQLAHGVLDARALFPNSSLADLYDPLTMPPELLKVHNALDRAVMRLYGFDKDMAEAVVVAALMEKYRELAQANR
jgi:hypothetical protein